MTMGSQALVGVFNESSQAEAAIEQLHNAGIPDHQISYSGSTANNGFLATIKSLFTGANTSADALLNDLTAMGLPQDEAQYYVDQHQMGRAIVAVNPSDRLLQAQTILSSNGSYNYRAQQAGSDLYPHQSNNDNAQAQVPDYSRNAVPDSVRTRNTTQADSYAQNPSLEYAQPGNADYNPANRPVDYAQPNNPDYTNPNAQPTNNSTQPNGANYNSANRPVDYAQPSNPDYTNPNEQAGSYTQAGSTPNDYRQQPARYAQPSNQTYDPNSRADTYAQPSNATYDPASQAGTDAQPRNPNAYRQPAGYAQQGVVDPTNTGYAQQGVVDPTSTGYVDGQGAYTNPNVRNTNTDNQTAEEHQQHLSDWMKREKSFTENEKDPQTRETDASQNNY